MPTLLSVFGVEPNRIGGTETFARELSSQLADRGWKSVLCFEKLPPPDVAKFLELPNVTVEVLANPTDPNWSATRRLASLLRQYKPEMLHLHFVGFVGLYPWLAKTLATKKIFFTDHSSRPSGYVPTRAPFWKRQLVRLINYPITKVICVSKYGRHCMQALDLLDEVRFELVYNGVDLSRVAHDPTLGRNFRDRYKISADKNVVVQVSWIIPEKGIGELLEVARRVKANNANVHFLIVGDGPYKREYMQQAEQMGISDTITWTGLIKDPFGEGVFAAADVVCQLSQWEEVFGWMIAEAMAYGKPVVAARAGGIPELIDHGISGFIEDRQDLEKVASDLTELLSSIELRGNMGSAGQNKVAANFNLKTNVRQLLDVYGI